MEGRILSFEGIRAFIKRYKTPFLVIAGLFVGASVSSGLLLYTGKELVNALIYLFFIVLLPTLFSTLTLLVFFIKRNATFALRAKESFLFGLFFSIGALMALLVTITTKDIAFGWATTLAVSPKEFHALLDKLAIWKSFCNSCSISQELANISRYTRLGGAISSEQVANAVRLGQWWRFLAMSIVVYGVLLRALYWLITLLFSQKSLSTFQSERNSDSFNGLQKSSVAPTPKEVLKSRNFRLVGYDVASLEGLGLTSNGDAKDVVITLYAWEPPILEFFDFAKEYESRGGRISLLLLGVNGEKPSDEDIAIWQDKLLQLDKNYEVIV